MSYCTVWSVTSKTLPCFHWPVWNGMWAIFHNQKPAAWYVALPTILVMTNKTGIKITHVFNGWCCGRLSCLMVLGTFGALTKSSWAANYLPYIHKWHCAHLADALHTWLCHPPSLSHNPPIHLVSKPPLHLSPAHLALPSTLSPTIHPTIHLVSQPPLHLSQAHLALPSTLSPTIHPPIHLVSQPPLHLSPAHLALPSTLSPTIHPSIHPVGKPPLHLSPAHLALPSTLSPTIHPPIHLVSKPPLHLSPAHLALPSTLSPTIHPSIHPVGKPPLHLSPAHLALPSNLSPTIHPSNHPSIYLQNIHEGFVWQQRHNKSEQNDGCHKTTFWALREATLSHTNLRRKKNNV